MAAIIPIKLERSCDGCTKCCDGWLTGSAHGHDFYPGKKCYWSSKNGCNIYDYRPHDPCVTFKCYWKTNHLIPFEFKPNKIGVIFVERFLEGFFFLDVNYGGNSIPKVVIDWLYEMLSVDKLVNVRYRQDGKYVCLSNDNAFHDMMKNYFGKENVV